MAVDFRDEIWNMGVQSPDVPHEWDSEAKAWHDNRIDDVDLAHDMALAMDPVMEHVIEQRKFLGQLAAEPDATYRRAGKKAIIFSELIETQKAIEDEKGEHTFNYRPESTVEDYLHKAISSYIFEKEGRSTYYTPWVPKKEARITNGFVAQFAKKQLNRTEQAADKAGAIVYFKQKERENIAVFEANLSKRDQEIFQRIKHKDEARESSSQDWLEGDEEALSLSRRVSELWDIYTRKRIVEMVAKTFGRSTTRGFTRQDFEQLADVVDDSHYTLTH